MSASASTGPLTAPPAKPTPHIFLDRLQELKTCRCSLLLEYLIQFCIRKTSLIPRCVPSGAACRTLLCSVVTTLYPGVTRVAMFSECLHSATRKCALCKMECCVFIPSYSSADEVIGILSNYLLSELPLDIENVHRGAMTLRHLKCTLGTACQGLHRSALFTLLLGRS